MATTQRFLRIAGTLACTAACGATLAQSGGINVVAPTLPPRQPAATAQGGGAPAASPGYNTSNSQAQPAPATSGRGGAGYGAQYGGGVGAAPSAAAPSALASGRASGPAYGYAPQPGYGPAEAPAAAIAARSTAAGNCRAELSPDRQSISLMGADALPRQHVPLGEFRAQRVLHSPDGRWAVAFTKLRGRPQFALVSLDLARCEAAHTVDLPAEADDARFDGDEAIVRIGAGERRVRLASGRVR